jgi:hypothetical protein
MGEKNFGSNHFVVGKVVNRKDDPTQSGRCRVRWDIGGVTQSDMGENDLPWSKAIYPSGNPSKGGMGGPHTGFQEESTVYGFSPSGDGQDFIIIGSTPSAGNSQPGGTSTFDSDIPAAAKSQSVGGSSQPKFGDKNQVVTQNSIWQFGQDEGGPDKTASLHPDLDDSIGTTGKAITYA